MMMFHTNSGTSRFWAADTDVESYADPEWRL
jgi:hypothetical protein